MHAADNEMFMMHQLAFRIPLQTYYIELYEKEFLSDYQNQRGIECVCGDMCKFVGVVVKENNKVAPKPPPTPPPVVVTPPPIDWLAEIKRLESIRLEEKRAEAEKNGLPLPLMQVSAPKPKDESDEDDADYGGVYF